MPSRNSAKAGTSAVLQIAEASTTSSSEYALVARRMDIGAPRSSDANDWRKRSYLNPHQNVAFATQSSMKAVCRRILTESIDGKMRSRVGRIRHSGPELLT